MGLGRGCGQLICYNCGGPAHYAHNCTNLTRTSCLYCTQFDHEAEDYPTLIVRLREKGVLQPPLTQNLQMMRFESHEEDLNVNMMLRSSMTTAMIKGSSQKKVRGFARLLQRNLNLIKNVRRRHSWKLRRASQRPPLQVVRINQNQGWILQCSLGSFNGEMHETTTRQQGCKRTIGTYHQVCWIRRTARGMETWKACIAHRKRNEADCANYRV